MGKRSNFDRKPRDFYPTPLEAFIPLIDHLRGTVAFIEPCAGDVRLMDHLESCGFSCVEKYDIEPQREDVIKADVFSVNKFKTADFFITNPPWDRKILHPLICHLSTKAPTWLLFDADWMHTQQSSEYMRICKKIISVGRVKWIPESKMTGKDNCAWYLFDKDFHGVTEFVGRRR